MVGLALAEEMGKGLAVAAAGLAGSAAATEETAGWEVAG